MNFNLFDRAIYHYAGDRKFINYPLVKYYEKLTYD